MVDTGGSIPCVRRLTLAALVALLAWPAGAHAVSLSTRGDLLVRWHSNPDTCAATGLCGRSGTLAWRLGPESRLDLSELSFALIDIFGSDLVARSYRSAPDGTTATCIDRPDEPFGVAMQRAGKGHLIATLRELDQLSFGHCAGPLSADFKAALPESSPVSVAALARGATIDLRSRAPFAAGAFAGEVVSTLVLRTRRDRNNSETTSSGGGLSSPSPRGPKIRYGEVSALYDVTSFKGEAGFAFSGSDGPECFAFDTCGLTGDVTLRPELSGGAVFINSARRLKGAKKETLASGLSALRAGRTRVSADGELGASGDEDVVAPIPFTETATPPDGATCSDAGGVPSPYLNITRSARGLAAKLNSAGNSSPDPLRTRCPGPARDEFGALAVGVIPFAAIGDEQITVDLHPSTVFSTFGFRGSGHGTVTLSLKRRSLHAITRTVRRQRESGL